VTSKRKPARVNRIKQFISQVEDYWFHGEQKKLSRDAGVTESTLSRTINGKTNPRYGDVCRITEALERKLKRRTDPREIYR
jgi:predicted transcriptional regulator